MTSRASLMPTEITSHRAPRAVSNAVSKAACSRARSGVVLRALWAVCCIGSLSAGCASTPRPPVLDQSAAVAENPALDAERQWAPQAFAHAAQLQLQAEEAFDAGKRDESVALAEHALAAYQSAVAMARLAKAEQRIASAQQKLSTMRGERDELRTTQR